MSCQHYNKEDLGVRVGHASRLFRRKIDQCVAEATGEYDDIVSSRNVWVLKYLRDHEGEEVYQRDLEQAFRIRGSTVSNMIDLMEQKGLLVRAGSIKDARRKKLCLTEKANAILDSVGEAIHGFEERVRKSFRPEDFELLMNLLEQLCTTLDNMPDCGSGKELCEKS